MGLHDYTGNSGIPNTTPPPTGGTPGGPSGHTSAIHPLMGGTDPLELVTDYNKKFKMAQPILYRDAVIQQTLAVLIGKNKPNALLVGQAGVGKTAIVEDIARRIANNDALIPDALKGYTIYELPLSNIVAGSSFVGQVEEKIQSVIEFMSDPKNKAILFIDEIHQIVGESQTYDKIAQILKPALARGSMKVIGGTTLQEVGNLHKDPAFNRRFSRLIVDELSKAQTLEILKAAKAGLFMHYSNRISISDDILNTVVVLADQYRTSGSHRPDNALTLLDRTCGEAIVARKVMEIAAANDPALLQAIQSVPIIPITEKQLKSTAVKLMTGNNKRDDLDKNRLLTEMNVIKGQDDVVEKVIEKLKRYDLSLFPKNKPLTLLFAGPSGVGKTEVTKIIANVLTDMKPIILNMTEYHSSASINRIIGAPAGYIGSDSKAELPFDCLETNPYQVILLDEFEKGNKSVQRLFMQAFEEGFIKDNRNRIIDFSKCIIIATTNAGHTNVSDSCGFLKDTQEKVKSREHIANELKAWFDMELLNRFEDILTFHSLDKNMYRTIIIDKYHTEVARIRADKHRISLPDDIPDVDLDRIVEETYVSTFGARPAATAVRRYIEDIALNMTTSTPTFAPTTTTTLSSNDTITATVDNSDEHISESTETPTTN